MVNNVVTGTYTETYDLNTAIGELSMLAIHTPQSNALKRMFKGFYTQYRKLKILGCDFKMVCASRQELTPDLVGLEAGQVDPRDVLNPILFKACTGESINMLVDQIYNSARYGANSGGSSSVGQVKDNAQAAKDAYYQLLADESWRKSHPQSGITVMGLRPMVHKVVTTQPLAYDIMEGGTFIQGGSGGDGLIPSANGAPLSTAIRGFGSPTATAVGTNSIPVSKTVFVSNGITEMPWIDTTFMSSSNNPIVAGSGSDSGGPGAYIGNVPRVFMGALILPPAILQSLYFRLQIRWHVQFRDFRPAQDVMPVISASNALTIRNENIQGLGGNGDNTTYWNLYHTATTKEINPDSPLVEHSSFETNASAEVDQIMEKVQ